MAVKEKSLEVRYFTYHLVFPDTKEEWVRSVPFIHDLQFELKNTTFGKDPALARDILKKGECRWSDHNGVLHRVTIDDTPAITRWGNKVKRR